MLKFYIPVNWIHAVKKTKKKSLKIMLWDGINTEWDDATLINTYILDVLPTIFINYFINWIDWPRIFVGYNFIKDLFFDITFLTWLPKYEFVEVYPRSWNYRYVFLDQNDAYSWIF